jgi:hypothetical protein
MKKRSSSRTSKIDWKAAQACSLACLILIY